MVWVAGPVTALWATAAFSGDGRKGVIAWLAMFAAMAILSLWWARRKAPADPWTPGASRSVVEVVIGLVAVGAFLFYSMLASSFVEVPQPETTRILGEAARGREGFARLLLIVAVTLGPIGEELFFRGFLMHALARWGRGLALGVQAVVFALYHGYDVVGTLNLVAVGLGLGLLVMWRRGLVAAIVVHIGMNAYVAFAAGQLPPRAVIGVHCQREPGCRVAVAPEDKPAFESGVRVGDRITHFEGWPVDSQVHLIQLTNRFARPGQLVMLTIERDGQRLEIPLRLGVADD